MNEDTLFYNVGARVIVFWINTIFVWIKFCFYVKRGKMKDSEEFDTYLNSDAQQTIGLLEEKLSMAMMALRDIRVWSEDLSQAKNIASYILDKIDELQIVYSVEIEEQKK